MRIKTCDVCKKETNKEAIEIYFTGERFDHFDICHKCSEPVMKFLKKNKLT